MSEIQWKFYRGKFRPYEMTPEPKIHRCKCYPNPEPAIQKIGELEQRVNRIETKLDLMIARGYLTYQIPGEEMI